MRPDNPAGDQIDKKQTITQANDQTNKPKLFSGGIVGTGRSTRAGLRGNYYDMTVLTVKRGGGLGVVTKEFEIDEQRDDVQMGTRITRVPSRSCF